MHRFLSRSDEGAGLGARPASGYPRARGTRLCGSATANVLPAVRSVPRFIDMVTFVASATASSSRSDDDTMSLRIVEEERQRNRCRPAVTLRADGIAGDLCVARRRRCPCIASSLLLDLASQDPSANATISMKRDTRKADRVQRSQDR